MDTRLRELTSPGDALLVGYSGGADSAALLHHAAANAGLLGICVFAVHVDHGIRENAVRDAEFAQSTCRDMGIPIVVARANAPAYAADRGMEAAARRVRYAKYAEAVASLAREHGILPESFVVATAHTKNDQAETILMRLMRGTGGGGLGGIGEATKMEGMRLIRPMLAATRKDVEEYCRAHSIAFVEDETNTDHAYTRNRIRRELLPLMASGYNANIIDTLARKAHLVAEDEQVLLGLARDKLAELAHRKEGRLELCADGLCLLAGSLAGRVVRLAIAELCGSSEDISMAHTQAVLDIARGQTGRMVHIARGVTVRKQYAKLVISLGGGLDCGPLSKGFEYALVPEVPTYVEEAGLYFKASTHPGPGEARAFWVEGAALERYGITIRTRHPGDRIYIKSLGGRKKLSDYFIDEKVPRDLRGLVPLVCLGADVLWVCPQGPVDDRFLENTDDDSDGRTKIYVSVWGDKA